MYESTNQVRGVYNFNIFSLEIIFKKALIFPNVIHGVVDQPRSLVL
jgi:hypothetical protein